MAEARVRVQLAAILGVAVVVTGGLAAGAAWLRSAGQCDRLVVAASEEKSGLLQGFAAEYNREWRTVAGRCVAVAIENVTSADAERYLETGWSGAPGERPDVWSPAATAWLRLLKHRSSVGAGLVPDSADSLFQSPLVIAMPEPTARALDYPGNAAGWHEIRALEQNPAFRLGKTNPVLSTSGLHALIGAFYAFNPSTLQATGVDDPAARDFLAGIEAGVDHYGPAPADFLRLLRDADDRGAAPVYLSAIAVEEKEVVDYNAGRVGGGSHPAPRTRLVAVYPKEGTPVSDHPYAILRSSGHQAAARDFYEFLLQPGRQQIVDAAGFRDRRGVAGPYLSLTGAINPDQPRTAVTAPEGAVIQSMLVSWRAVRRPARLLIVVDAAAPGAPATARALAQALTGLQPRDQAGVWTFPATGRPYTELRPISPAGPELIGALTGLRPASGSGGLHAALAAAADRLARDYDLRSIDAVLLVELRPPSAIDPQLESALRDQTASAFVHVFTIGPASTALEGLALAGRGGSYRPGSAEHLLTAISNF